MKLKILILNFCFLIFLCDRREEILNVAPRITSIGPIGVEEKSAKIYFTIQDIEEDPCDVEVKYIMDGEENPINLLHSGHGTTGLTSSSEKEGTLHYVLWNIEGIDKNKMLKIKIIPYDILAGKGRALETPQWKLKDGFYMKVMID